MSETGWPARREAYITRIEVLIEALAEETRSMKVETACLSSFAAAQDELAPGVHSLKVEIAKLRREGAYFFWITMGLSLFLWALTITLIFLRT